MEKELNQLIHNRSVAQVEVVNAGVCGYNFSRIMKRIDDYLAVEPDLVTIYAGWNHTIGRADPYKNQFLYNNLSLYKIFYHFIVNRKDTGIQTNFSDRTFYQKDGLFIAKLSKYNYKYDINLLNKLISRIRNKDKSIIIVLITLAGLYDVNEQPDEKSLSIGYPISSTNNLYAYAVLSKIFNDQLRNNSKLNNVHIIDFEKYAIKNMVPRSAYFTDSVHPNVYGYMKMGKYFASQLVDFIPLQERTKKQ